MDRHPNLGVRDSERSSRRCESRRRCLVTSSLCGSQRPTTTVDISEGHLHAVTPIAPSPPSPRSDLLCAREATQHRKSRAPLRGRDLEARPSHQRPALDSNLADPRRHRLWLLRNQLHVSHPPPALRSIADRALTITNRASLPFRYPSPQLLASSSDSRTADSCRTT